MFNKFFPFFTITLFMGSTTQQLIPEHPLCGHKGDRIWVPDPANCHGYLYCHWDPYGYGNLLGVYQLDCRNQFSNHFEPSEDGTVGECVDDVPECQENPLFLCPPSSVHDLMIANFTDPTCTQYRPCRLPGFPWLTCRSPLVFNRNTGACDYEYNAPCSDPFRKAECPPHGTGNFPGSWCFEYIFCYDGALIGKYECGEGLHFDEYWGNCMPDYYGYCVRPTGFVPPRVKNGKSRKNVNVDVVE